MIITLKKNLRSVYEEKRWTKQLSKNVRQFPCPGPWHAGSELGKTC